MDCPQVSLQDTFKRINAVAHSIRALCKGDKLPLPTPLSLTQASTSRHATDAPTLYLPVPETPAALMSVNCSPEVKTSIEIAFSQAAHEIRQACLERHDRIVKFIHSDPSRSSQAAHSVTLFERQYGQQIHALEELTISKLVQLQQPQADTTGKAKATFNREFIPLLETYFDYNAYPSALDRATLARKSMMTPRQIEVWFQNHRNRAKKEGRKLKKLTTDPLPLELSLKPLEKKMPFFMIPEDQRRDPLPVAPPTPDTDLDVDDEVMASTQHDTNAKFNLDAPPHAFPTVYPPCWDYNPFPIKTGAYKFPAPVWYRKPAALRRTPKLTIDFDEFIADFDTKLHLRAPVSQQQRSKSTQSWCAGRVIVPPPAPHPALVRTPVLPTSIRASLPAVSAPSSRLRPFRSPSPFSQPATLIPAQQFNDTSIRRKVARLPRRTPRNTSIAHRRGSPAISESSPAPSQSPSSTSRSLSFGSDVASDRQPSSSYSSSSSSSSALTTPELLCATLPEDARSPSVSVSGLDFRDMGGMFGDSRETSSPVEGIPFDFSVDVQSKQLPAFSFEIPSAGHLESRRVPGRSRSPPS